MGKPTRNQEQMLESLKKTMATYGTDSITEMPPGTFGVLYDIAGAKRFTVRFGMIYSIRSGGGRYDQSKISHKLFTTHLEHMNDLHDHEVHKEFARLAHSVDRSVSERRAAVQYDYDLPAIIEMERLHENGYQHIKPKKQAVQPTLCYDDVVAIIAGHCKTLEEDGQIYNGWIDYIRLTWPTVHCNFYRTDENHELKSKNFCTERGDQWKLTNRKWEIVKKA